MISSTRRTEQVDNAGQTIKRCPHREMSGKAMEPALSDGRVLLARLNGAVAGTFTLEWTDPLWTDAGAAGYVHRLAVRRAAAGLGARLLAWAGPLCVGAVEGCCAWTARQPTCRCGPTTTGRGFTT
jgi:hypothetical protein